MTTSPQYPRIEWKDPKTGKPAHIPANCIGMVITNPCIIFEMQDGSSFISNLRGLIRTHKTLLKRQGWIYRADINRWLHPDIAATTAHNIHADIER